MKTIKEYYDQALTEQQTWIAQQKTKWWMHRFVSGRKVLGRKGDYIESVKFISDMKKNDVPLFHNHTNVKNSEWCILMDMLGAALVDWCKENVDWKNLWSVSTVIKRNIDSCSNIYDCSIKVNNVDEKNRIPVQVTDDKDLEKFGELIDVFTEMFDWFITKQGKNIPNDWNKFTFSLDDLMESCKWGKWVSDSDGYMHLGYYNEKSGRLTDFVECM